MVRTLEGRFSWLGSRWRVELYALGMERPVVCQANLRNGLLDMRIPLLPPRRDLAACDPTDPDAFVWTEARVAGSADSFSIMLFVVNMLFVVMLVLDCLVCVYGVRIEDHSRYLNCIANPAGCTWLYAARPSPCSVCEPVTRSPSLSG